MANDIEEADNLQLDEPTNLAPTVWVEKTLVQDRPDRLEGPDRVGVALWSPQLDAGGRDIYANMREVKPGDLVLHLTNNDAITGLSMVADMADDTFKGVSGTNWSERPCYRVAFTGFPFIQSAFAARMVFCRSRNRRAPASRVEPAARPRPLLQ